MSYPNRISAFFGIFLLSSMPLDYANGTFDDLVRHVVPALEREKVCLLKEYDRLLPTNMTVQQFSLEMWKVCKEERDYISAIIFSPTIKEHLNSLSDQQRDELVNAYRRRIYTDR